MPGSNPDPHCLCDKGKICSFFTSLILSPSHTTMLCLLKCLPEIAIQNWVGDPVVQHTQTMRQNYTTGKKKIILHTHSHTHKHTAIVDFESSNIPSALLSSLYFLEGGIESYINCQKLHSYQLTEFVKQTSKEADNMTSKSKSLTLMIHCLWKMTPHFKE